ncbi:MAG: hypothetical protein ACK5MK_00370 [Dysgonomonas sp.]
MKENIIKIGDRKLSSITAEEVLRVAIIEGCIAHTDYWNEPTIIYFDDTMFTDTVVLDYKSTHKEDNRDSNTITFFFDHKGLDFHYHSKILDRSHGKRFSFETIRYLLKQGFYLPLKDQ